MIQTYLQNRNRITDLREQTYAYGGGKMGIGIDWEFGINIHTLLHFK